MRDSLALASGDCHLVVIDVQGKLLPAMPADRQAEVVAALGLLGTAARLLGVPVTVTEHVPEAIGGTAPRVLALFDAPAVIGKLHFGAANEPALLERVAAVGRPRLLLCGMEAHVCVLQTALGLRARGHEVLLVADACCSRRPYDEALALERARRHDIEVVSSEMVAFEWLHRADHPARRELIAAIKAAAG